jgi:hypothetical protein
MGFSRSTPKKFKTSWSSFEIPRDRSVATAGTFNSVVCISSTFSVLNDRYFFRAFPDTDKYVGHYSAVLPNGYKNGTDIKVRLIVTSLGTSNNMKYVVGLSQLSSTDVFSNDSDTQYLSSTIAADSDGVDFKAIDGGVLTFSGTNLVAGEPINFVVYRDPADAADTISATTYLEHVVVYFQRESKQPETSNFKDMLPNFRTVYTTLNIRGGRMTGDAGTFNGLTCVAAGSVTLNSRWRSTSYADAAKTVATADFVLPVEFVAGLPIIVEVSGYTSQASTANVFLGVGISRTAINTVYKQEGATTYVTAATALTAAFDKVKKTFSFPSTGFVAGDIIAIAVYREGDSASDTSTTNWRVTNVAVRLPINSNGVENIT